MIEGPIPEGYKYCPHCKSKKLHGHDILINHRITVWCAKCRYSFSVYDERFDTNDKEN